jgi:hypothetical protein
MAEKTEPGVVVDKEPVYVDPSLIWKAGMGVVPSEAEKITPPKPAKGVIPLIVDIETTGLNPWECRIICIGYKDPAMPDSDPICILDEDEEKILLEFLSVFVAGKYNQLIMYNGAFDYRFIFARCLYYRITCKEWVNASIYDIMQVMQQVKQTYVYSMNKSGGLDNWITFLLGVSKTLTFEEMLAAWELKEYLQIIEYNINDVQTEFLLYALIESVKQNPFTGASFAIAESQAQGSTEAGGAIVRSSQVTQEAATWIAECPNCFATAEVPASQPVYFCKICNTMIKKYTGGR